MDLHPPEYGPGSHNTTSNLYRYAIYLLQVALFFSYIKLQLLPPYSPTGDEENTMPTTPAHLRSMAERDARAMEAATRAMEQATKRMEQASKTASSVSPPGEKRPESRTPPIKSEGEPPLKRPATEEERLMAHVGMPSAHLKITSRSEQLFNMLFFDIFTNIKGLLVIMAHFYQGLYQGYMNEGDGRGGRFSCWGKIVYISCINLVLWKRSVQKGPFWIIPFETAPPWKSPCM